MSAPLPPREDPPAPPDPSGPSARDPSAKGEPRPIRRAAAPEPGRAAPAEDATAGRGAAPGEKSYGNMGPGHWSVARKDQNQPALEYYRERSQAPGVEAGGGPRNHYCMQCDGVIPWDQPLDACPHCGSPIDPKVRRFFNWVEIDSPPRSDLLVLLPVLAIAGLVALACLLVLRWFRA